MPDNSVEIQKIEAILNEGVESATIDGETVRYDLAALRKRLVELKNTDTTGNYTPRPRAANINLGFGRSP